MDIDPDVARWILEFLLRNPLDDGGTSNALIQVLLPANYNPSLRKTVLLREIESKVSNGSVSEKMLGLLEKFEELDFREGIQASEYLRAAYCAVAVDCTVRFLKNGGEESSKGEYFSAVKRIWRQRICRMEKEGNAGLVSEELSNWRDEIEAAVWEDSFCDNVMRRSEGIDAVGSLKAFVKEAREKMIPSFLEYMAETFTRELLLSENKDEQGQIGENDAALPSASQDSTHHNKGKFGGILMLYNEYMAETFTRELLLSENKDEQGQIGENDAALPSASQDSTHHNKELHKGKSVTKQHVARKHTKSALAGTSRGAKVADSDDLRAEASHKQYDLPASPEVNKAQEALETSFQELRAVVKDPLPDALHLAATIMCDMSRGNMGDQPIQENASKRSLMERNSTAHAYEWDDSINNLPEGSRSREMRPHLPSPEISNISPLKKYEINKLTKRRKTKKWSLIEEDTLRTGVQRFGRGNWKLILQTYRDIFEERTEGDLKDKWRNMTR